MIGVHELQSQPILTQNMIDDSSIDIEGWAQDKIVQDFTLRAPSITSAKSTPYLTRKTARMCSPGMSLCPVRKSRAITTGGKAKSTSRTGITSW
jgi:hypothetical protein